MFDHSSLPYSAKSLEPWITEKSLRFHHEVLHAGYVHRLNQLTRGTHLAQVPLAELIRGLDTEDQHQAEVWKMAAQAWNHDFLWKSMKPGGGGRPRGALRTMIGTDRSFREMFKATASSVFGSGWVWLMASPDGTPQLWAGQGAENPMRYGFLPLLTCDCWEHAYYLDYPANRADYIDAFLDHLVNWEFASANYERSFG